MSSTIKTILNDASVQEFINTVGNEAKRQDSLTLLEVYKRVTNQKPKMWGPSIIGFGQYHYVSAKGTQEGDMPLAAFSPRKQSLTLYVEPEAVDYSDLLKDLGKHKTSKACLYINKLADVDMNVLEKIIERGFLNAKKNLPPQ